jgi:hypothetical protein
MRREEAAAMPVMGFTKFERFFRAAGGQRARLNDPDIQAAVG